MRKSAERWWRCADRRLINRMLPVLFSSLLLHSTLLESFAQSKKRRILHTKQSGGREEDGLTGRRNGAEKENDRGSNKV